MEYLDARRLTGPNLLWDRPGSVLDIRCEQSDIASVAADWSVAVRGMLDAVGWQDEELRVHPLSGGVSLAFSAPVDALYSATEINEWAWTVIDCGQGGAAPVPLARKADEIRALIVEEANPPLLALGKGAKEHGVAFLWDDDDVSVGMGSGSETWPSRAVPAAGALDWARYHDVPVGIVTGTNGKTTTVRLATHIACGAGRRTGVSCTDWIAVGDRVIERGDWSGPGGARRVLRQTGVELAILETARGGLLRRGLGVDRADAALITNVAEDHLGDFGSQSVEELLDIKWIVSRAVVSGGVLVLNADDQRLVSKAGSYPGVIHWFSLHPDNAVIAEHRAAGGVAWLLDGDRLLRTAGPGVETVCTVSDMPIALGGAARHNIANALAASALTAALGVPVDAVAAGLRTMTQAGNPGRSNLYELDGFRVVVDFAHNPHAMAAVFEMATAMPAKRRLLVFGQAGDRTDAQIRELARRAWSIGLDQVAVSELAQYHRGREHGDVYALIRDELERCGAAASRIQHFEEEIDALEFALDWAEPGDLVIFLALARADSIHERLGGYRSRPDTPPP